MTNTYSHFYSTVKFYNATTSVCFLLTLLACVFQITMIAMESSQEKPSEEDIYADMPQLEDEKRNENPSSPTKLSSKEKRKNLHSKLLLRFPKISPYQRPNGSIAFIIMMMAFKNSILHYRDMLKFWDLKVRPQAKARG